MALNWLEEVVSHVYRLKGYLVLENLDLLLPANNNRRIAGHSDIDIIAFNRKEIVHIECQTWWVPAQNEVQRRLQNLSDRFENGIPMIMDNYPISENLQMRKIFVVGGRPHNPRNGGPWARLEQFCNQNDIELVEVNNILREFIRLLHENYPDSQNIGKEIGISRFLLHLIHNDFIKEELLANNNQ